MLMRNKLIAKLQTVVLLLMVTASLNAQTVGTLKNDSLAFNGYTLLAPINSTTTYLIDNCGYVVNEWYSSYTPGLVAYLLEDGSLLRSGKIASTVFTGAGNGGIVERFNWSGNLIWSMTFADSLLHQHHDIEYLPNGNILVLVWEYRSRNEALAAGRISTWNSPEIWPEKILEIQPTGTNGGTVVWEWKVWDHLIQDIDSLLPNYGVIADHPERININYMSGAGGLSSDWIHGNSISYHAGFDQIIISAHNFDECWVIDHSTTTQDAAGSSGGRSGKGGDLLYRWGNPAAYNRGTAADQQLFGQHDVHYIANALSGNGSMIVFNNGRGRPGGNYSSVDIFNPPVDALGNYQDPQQAAYGPSLPLRQYTATPPSSFYAANISGASVLPNGNILVCEGPAGLIFEINDTDSIVWTYKNPVGRTGPVSQGSTPIGNSVFRAYRYAPSYPAFAGRILTPGNRIELNPGPSTCTLYSDSIITAIPAFSTENKLNLFIYPNPVSSVLHLRLTEGAPVYFKQMRCFDVTGREVLEFRFGQDNGRKEFQMDVSALSSGLYFLHVEDNAGKRYYSCFQKQ